MINVTVINLKSIVKYFILALIFIFIFSIVKVFSRDKVKNISINTNISLVSCLNTTLPKIDATKEVQKLKEISSTSNGLTAKRILNMELPMIDKLIIDGEENEYIEIDTSKQQETQNIEIAKTDVKTEQIEENNITPKYNNVFGSVKVKNESDKEINEEILTPNISLENNKDIIIFHTHTCESYTTSEQFNYEMTGSYRTTDLNYSVARVGTELEKQLQGYGYNVIHNRTYHDYPAYSGSYGRSLETVKNILESGSNAQMIIDLHRDAVRK